MKHSFEVEVRSEREGYEPTLRGVMLVEGRAASGGIAELFAPGSVTWPHDGVRVNIEHGNQTETRGQVVRGRDGKLTLTARATDGIRQAVKAGKRFMSVEFRAMEERRVKSGVREVLRAFVDAVALTEAPYYDTTSAEVRSQDRRRLWL